VTDVQGVVAAMRRQKRVRLSWYHDVALGLRPSTSLQMMKPSTSFSRESGVVAMLSLLPGRESALSGCQG